MRSGVNEVKQINLGVLDEPELAVLDAVRHYLENESFKFIRKFRHSNTLENFAKLQHHSVYITSPLYTRVGDELKRIRPLVAQADWTSNIVIARIFMPYIVHRSIEHRDLKIQGKSPIQYDYDGLWCLEYYREIPIHIRSGMLESDIMSGAMALSIANIVVDVWIQVMTHIYEECAYIEHGKNIISLIDDKATLVASFVEGSTDIAENISKHVTTFIYDVIVSNSATKPEAIVYCAKESAPAVKRMLESMDGVTQVRSVE